MWAKPRLCPGFWESMKCQRWQIVRAAHVICLMVFQHRLFSAWIICCYGCFQAFAPRCSCRAVIHIAKFGMLAVILTRVCHLCDDMQASDLLYLRPAAGVPDPRVRWPGLPEIPAAEPEQRPRQGQSSHMIRMWSHIFTCGLLGGGSAGTAARILFCALYNLSFTVTSVSGESWKLPENAAARKRRSRCESFQVNKCVVYQNM